MQQYCLLLALWSLEACGQKDAAILLFHQGKDFPILEGLIMLSSPCVFTCRSSRRLDNNKNKHKCLLLNTEFAGRVCPYYKAPRESKDRVVVNVLQPCLEGVLAESKIRKMI